LVCEISTIPHFLDNRLSDGGEVVSLTRRPPFPLFPKNIPGTHLCSKASPRAIVRLEGVLKLKKASDLIGTRTRDLPTCSIVPEPITLSSARAQEL
jgi:hypothetical protein